MKLNEVTDLRGLKDKKVKILRHTTKRAELQSLIQTGNFELYQSYQKNNEFKDAEYIISFKAVEGTEAILYGVFEVEDVQMAKELPEVLIPISMEENWGDGPYFKYKLIRMDWLKDLEERLIIDWGKSTRTWCQKKLDKEIVEILRL